jgi:urease subunit alpha
MYSRPMFGALGRARGETSVMFTSAAAQAAGVKANLGLEKTVLAVQGTRGIGKSDMILNAARPQIEVNPETYEVRANGELLTCAPATTLPLAQRYFLF